MRWFCWIKLIKTVYRMEISTLRRLGFPLIFLGSFCLLALSVALHRVGQCISRSSFETICTIWLLRHTKNRGFPFLVLGDSTFLCSFLRQWAYQRKSICRTSTLHFSYQILIRLLIFLALRSSRQHMTLVQYVFEIFLEMRPKSLALCCCLSAEIFWRIALAERHIKVDVVFCWPKRIHLGKPFAGVNAKLAVTVFQINLNIPFDFRKLSRSFHERDVFDGGVN